MGEASAGVAEASIDFNAQILACGVIEIDISGLQPSTTTNLNAVYRRSGADLIGSHVLLHGHGRQQLRLYGVVGPVGRLSCSRASRPTETVSSICDIYIGTAESQMHMQSSGQTSGDYAQYVLSET